MKVTVLIENTMQSEMLKCEHGLSFWIEFQGKNYLLDAGTTDAFIENAKKLEIPIYDTNTCILSHGHYDHSGGFGTYLRENQNAKLYMMKDATKEYYSGSGGVIHEIGIPKEVIMEHKDKFIFVDKITKLEENIYIVPHNTCYLERIGKRTKLYRKEENTYIPDDFSHECSLVFDTKKGLILFNSCSHGGLINILKEVFPNKNIYAFFGGLHMKGREDENEIKAMITYLKEIGLQHLYTGHCTGSVALQMLKKYGGELVAELFTGRIDNFIE